MERSAPAVSPPAARESGAVPGGRRGLVLAGACLAVAMAGIDTTVVNVALASIQVDLGGSFTTLQWILNAYLLTSSALVLIGGRIGDRLGRRRVFAVGLGIFLVASVLAGAADANWWLIAARAIQGVGLALMLPGALALIAAAYPGASERERALGLW